MKITYSNAAITLKVCLSDNVISNQKIIHFTGFSNYTDESINQLISSIVVRRNVIEQLTIGKAIRTEVLLPSNLTIQTIRSNTHKTYILVIPIRHYNNLKGFIILLRDTLYSETNQWIEAEPSINILAKELNNLNVTNKC